MRDTIENHYRWPQAITEKPEFCQISVKKIPSFVFNLWPSRNCSSKFLTLLQIVWYGKICFFRISSRIFSVLIFDALKKIRRFVRVEARENAWFCFPQFFLHFLSSSSSGYHRSGFETVRKKLEMKISCFDLFQNISTFDSRVFVSKIKVFFWKLKILGKILTFYYRA